MSRDDEGKSRFFSGDIAETTTHLTLFLVPPPGEVMWKNFKTIEIDTSPAKVPAGSVAFFNYSKSVIVGEIGTQKILVAPGKRQLIPASSALNERGMVAMELKNRAKDGELVGLTRTARRLRGSDRLFLVAYEAIEPLIKGQPTVLMSYVDSCSHATVREKLKKQ